MRLKKNEENKETDLDTEDILNLFDFEDDMWCLFNKFIKIMFTYILVLYLLLYLTRNQHHPLFSINYNRVYAEPQTST